MSSIRLEDGDIDFSCFNDNPIIKQNKFFIDSFTCTPFIDYAIQDSK